MAAALLRAAFACRATVATMSVSTIRTRSGLGCRKLTMIPCACASPCASAAGVSTSASCCNQVAAWSCRSRPGSHWLTASHIRRSAVAPLVHTPHRQRLARYYYRANGASAVFDASNDDVHALRVAKMREVFLAIYAEEKNKWINMQGHTATFADHVRSKVAPLQTFFIQPSLRQQWADVIQKYQAYEDMSVAQRRALTERTLLVMKALVTQPVATPPVTDDRAAQALELGTSSNGVSLSPSPSPELSQRTPEWFAKRRYRLTASAFAVSMGFLNFSWNSGDISEREKLWEEKVGLREPWGGNEKTAYGTKQEPMAVQRYEELLNRKVTPLGFMVYHEGEKEMDWLGASPDGLLEPTTSAEGRGGVLEVKCPYRKKLAFPYYYVPQVQGLMEILDRDWCDMYVYTPDKGSIVYRIERDAQYWREMYALLQSFWWKCVVPAKEAMAAGDIARAQLYRPEPMPASAVPLLQKSKDIVDNLRGVQYPKALLTSSALQTPARLLTV
eukprot:jgi/Chlat1/3814/Chrsp26S04045